MKTSKGHKLSSFEKKFWHIVGKIAAYVFDFYTAFYLGSISIVLVKGGSVWNEPHFDGPELIALVIFILTYLVVGKYFFGGTIWQRLLAPK